MHAFRIRIGLSANLGPWWAWGWWLWLGAFWVGMDGATAQDNLRFDPISIELGLAHRTVHTIHQDRSGLLWFGTEDGLNVYDGYHFKTYREVEGDPHQLSNNSVKAIHQDRQGRLWIGTEAGLNRFDPATQTFRQYRTDNTPMLISDHIRRIAEDDAGHLWFATDNGVMRVREMKDTAWVADHFLYFEHVGIRNQHALAHPTVRGMLLDSRNRLWIGTDGGGVYLLEGLDSARPRWTHFDNAHPATAGMLPSGRVNSFSEDVYGNIWLGTWGDGVIKLASQAQGWRAVHYTHTPGCTDCIAYNRVTNLYADSRGYLWVGTYNMGVNRVTIQSHTDDVRIDRYLSDKFNAYSLAHNTAYCFWEDQSSDLWIGTYGDGLSKLSYRNNRILLYSAKNGYDYPVLNEVWGITTAPNGDWWISAWDGGIARIRPQSSAERTLNYRRDFTFYRHDPSQRDALSDDKVTDLLVDDRDRLWATTWGGYVNVAERASTRNRLSFTRIPIDGFGYFVHQDQRGRVWVGTNRGLFQILGAEQRGLSPNAYRAAKVEGLPSDRIRAMAEAPDGGLWVGTVDAGLIYLPPDAFASGRVLTTEDFRHYRHRVADTTSLASDHLFTLCVTRKGEVWIGTSRGLSHWMPSLERFETIDSRSGLLNNDLVMAIAEDGQGFLWVTTERGLVKLSPQDRQSILWEAYDGLQGHIFTANSVARDPQGFLLFGGRDGLNVIDPSLMIPSRKVPPLLITNVAANNVPLLRWPIGMAENVPPSYSLRYDENLLTFEFAALSYAIDHGNNYQYRLSGFEEEWRTLVGKNTVTYTNLDPGKYLFEVKCANSDGVWSETPQQIAIEIRPPIWATTWFRVLLGLLLIGGTTWYVWERITGAERKNKMLEAIVEERTREIQRQKQLVEERSRFKEQFFSNVSHELRTPLNGIIGLSYLLQRTSLAPQQRQYSHVIKDSAEHLLAIINDLLDISKINIGKLQLRAAPFDVHRAMEVLRTLMQSLATPKGIDLRWEVEAGVPTFLLGDAVRLQQILINLVGNAIKFTEAGHVGVRLSLEADTAAACHIRLEVWDTGIGIPADKLDNIFQSYEQVIDGKGYHYEGTGLGLTIVANLVELLGGTIEVESEVGHGSTFAVRLPFERPSEAAVHEWLARQPQSLTDGQWHGKHILLIEDNPVNTLYAEQLLQVWGIVVTKATTVAEARLRLHEATYDGIISDAMLPDGNGLALMAELQADASCRNAQTPVVALSAATDSGLQHAGLRLHAALTKPFSPQGLDDAFRRMWVDAPAVGPVPSAYFEGLEALMGGNTSRMHAFVGLVRDQIEPALAAITKAIAEEAWGDVAYHAHTLKSSLRTIGCKALAERLQAIEDWAQGDGVEAANLKALAVAFEQAWRAEQAVFDAAWEALAKP